MLREKWDWVTSHINEHSVNVCYCCSVLSHVLLFVTPWTAARHASLSFTISWHLLKLMPTESVMPFNHLILCCPLLLLLSITSVLPMNTQGWSLGWTGWISLLSKELSSVFHYSSKASVLWCSAFFMAQLSHLYITTGKTIDLTIQNFVGKVMSLLFNTLSRFVIAFLPWSKFF